MIRKIIIFLFLFVLVNSQLFSIDTLLVDSSDKNISLLKKLYLYEDKHDKFSIEDIRSFSNEFKRNNERSLNYGYTLASYWLHFKLKNISSKKLNYIFSITNPDLNIVEFYEFSEDSAKAIRTGEAKTLSSRDVMHNYFVFNILLEPGKVYDYYIRVNSEGEANYIPVKLEQESYFKIEDDKEKVIKWFIYGLLIFVVVFNLYLFKSLKDSINLHYALYMLFGALFLIFADGYHAYLNISWITNRSKTIIPALMVFFLLNFSQIFLETKENWPFLNKVINILKLLAILSSIFYFFNFPIFVISLIGLPLTLMFTLTAIISVSVISLNKDYLPSVFFLIAFFCVLIGVIILQLKEFGILPSTLLIENTFRIGMTLEAILLTIAVLERFRIQQDEAKKTIETSYEQINEQNIKLEKANVELERLSLAARETHNSIAIYDIKGNMEWCNEGFLKLNQVRGNHLKIVKGKNIRTIINHREINILVDRCMNEKEPVIFETNLKLDDKKDVWVQTTLTPYINEKGELAKLIAIDSNITQLKNFERDLTAAKERAELSDKLKSAFLSNMSHEIRTPLNAILGFSSLLIRKNKTDEQKVKYQEIIKNNSNHLVKIINDILNISKIESGEIEIESYEGELNKTLKEMHTHFHYKYIVDERKDIDFEFTPGFKDGDDRMISDFNKLRQILTNLLLNAFKFTSEGSIVFGYSQLDNHIMFYVKDTGIGIPESKRDMIFDRFNQAELGLSRRYGGVGLGLSISSGFVKRLGGKMWVESAEDKGSSFYFTLPYMPGVKKDSTEFKIYTEKDYNWKDKLILVVEDMMESYMYLEEILLPTKARMLHAKNGQDGVTMAKEHPVDLILMDIRLPDISGYDATKQIKEFKKKVPIIAQTANATLNEREECMKAGCINYLSKPINHIVLLDMINEQFM